MAQVGFAQSQSSPTKTTSNFGRYKDSTPHLTAAGKVLTDPGDTVEACVKQEIKGRQSTPPHVRPFRKSFTNEPGRINTHYGKAFDAPPPNIRFGTVCDTSETARNLIQPIPESAFADKQRTLKESVYLSSKREPLGQGKRSAEKLPQHTQEEKFRYGCRTIGSESAKNLMYPRDDHEDEEEERRAANPAFNSVKAERRYEAGEQRQRGYNWQAHGIDPGCFRFGAKEIHQGAGGVAQALKPDQDTELHTVIVRKIVEDYKDTMHDELGQPKNLGFGGRAPKGHTYGRAMAYDNWGARECIRGDPNEELSKPDKDLGRSIKPGTRNFTDDPRVFGVPTIRSDIAKPKRKRVTDFQNYGDEPKTVGLMYPSKYADDDVYEEDFLQPIEKEALAEIMQASGEEVNASDFEMAWNLATTMTSTGTVCVETFRQAMDQLGL
eukprot:TRINITY_DN13068_c0_g1_i1.p2 TRINITY_DN13068_c0_g1~~TRINITY_DN13068_c0_g1_i1.p2  ORF type:complete len:437 (+),score=34.67 TRINITY_DN13068_c0_g1_i1:39-1349(+)